MRAHAPRERQKDVVELDAVALGDLRFRALLPAADWTALPAAVHRRFSKRLARGDTAIYVGRIVSTRFSRAGWCLAHAARLVGGPLPIARDTGVASVVSVTEDGSSGGQNWTRLYARRTGFPQIIHSVKRFAGPSGLEEYVGRGIGMALDAAVEDGALTFRSRHFFLEVLGRRLRVPRWLLPINVRVAHADLGGGRFRFTLEVVGSFGPMITQVGEFADA